VIEINLEDIAAIRNYCRLTVRLLRRPMRMLPQEIAPVRKELVESYRRIWESRGAANSGNWHEDEYDSGELRWSFTDRRPEQGTEPNSLTEPRQKRFPFRLAVKDGAFLITTKARTADVALRWGEYRVPDNGGQRALARRVVRHYRDRIVDIWRGERVRA
jgi:hypothetical protein